MDAWLRDLKYGIKLLIKDRGFAATAILTLAVCIGANTAIFTVVNSVLLQPLPVPEADRILLMSNQYPKAGVGRSNNSGVPDYYDRLREITVFEEQAMFNNNAQTIEINGIPERVRGLAATPTFFRLIGVAPIVGRAFTDAEGEVGNETKVILSYSLWQNLFNGDPNVIGKTLRMTGRQYEVVGVMPQGFIFVQPEARYWIPLAFTDQQKSIQGRHSNNWYNIGRLKHGATLEQAQQQMDALTAANFERFPQFKELLMNAGFHTTVEPLKEMLVRDIRGTLYLLWGGAALVLLIGAVNIANLTLARTRLRVKELATRLALGAARGQLARQLTIESVLVAIGGGVAGAGLGLGILAALRSIGLERIPRASEVQMDATALLFGFGIAVVIGFMIGIVPVFHAINVNLSSVLHEEGRTGTAGRGARFVRRSLVVAQVGLAFVLLVGAGLLLARFRALLRVDPGFTADGVLTASTIAPRVRYPDNSDLRSFMNRTLESIRALPGVAAAGAGSNIPLDGSSNDSVIIAEGYQFKPGESLISPRNLTVTPGYFEALTIGLVRGRYFDERDHENASTIIVDERLARKFWGDSDPIGRRVYLPSDINDLTKITPNTRFFSVVGVVRDVRFQDLAGSGNSAGVYYFPYAQRPFVGLTLAIKSEVPPEALIRSVRAEIAKIDPELPLFEIRTMSERTELSMMPRRASMLLALAFGSVALFLSAVGIYGVLAYLVAQRTREIGIRIALGSTAGGIFKLVLREGFVLVATGLALGVAGAVALRNAIEAQIYGVRPLDPVVMSAVVVTLGIVAIVACVMPARRATQVDPVTVLNS
ncbi:MAG: ABC transporter permease [Acidobacteria bacterium]|nr:ABC transporter permease [Acidobacteriota bacterium]